MRTLDVLSDEIQELTPTEAASVQGGDGWLEAAPTPLGFPTIQYYQNPNDRTFVCPSGYNCVEVDFYSIRRIP